MTISRMIASASGASGWDISNLSYSGKSYSVGGTSQAKGLFFKPDGTKMFVTGNTLNKIYQYDLATPWDVSSVSSSSSASYTLPIGSLDPAEAISFKPDGTLLFVIESGSSFGSLVSFSLSSPWDVTTMSYLHNASASYDAKGLHFREDGQKYITVDGDQELRFFENDLSTAWDIRTRTSTTQSYLLLQSNATGVYVRRDGLKMFTSDAQTSSIYEYDLSSPWTLSGLSKVQVKSVGSQDSRPNDLFFAPNGKRLYSLGGTTNTVYQYDL